MTPFLSFLAFAALIFGALLLVDKLWISPWLRRLGPWSRTWRLGSTEVRVARVVEPSGYVGWQLTIN